MKSTSINPRKSPKQARARVTFDAILEAATRILQDDGLRKFNTNRVAEVAGVSVGTLYQYFPTKEAILTEIIRQKRKLMLDALTGATQDMAQERFEETLDKLLRAAVAHQLRWPKLARTLEYAEAFLPLEHETDALKVAIVETVAAFLAHHQHDTPVQTARDLVGALRGLIESAGLSGETDPAAMLIRARKLSLGYLR
jgi:AcrR family transcriptional regulator|tara:strand:+ start:202491 stop:203084 length:594 start_codon:yes stop_codon:yes gene_type:complete